MSRRPRRNHSSAFKAMALAAIKGERTLAQLAEQFANQITTWKAQLDFLIFGHDVVFLKTPKHGA